MHLGCPLLSQTVLTESRQLPDFPGACLIISTSMVILTSSPTTTPPLSKVAFHFTPKSWRLTLVVAVTAARTLPKDLSQKQSALNVEHDLLGGAVDGEVAGDFEFACCDLLDPLGLESD